MLNIKCHLKILPIKIEFSLFHRVSAKFKKYRKRGVPNRSVLARFSQSSQPTWTPTPLLTAFSARAVLTSFRLLQRLLEWRAGLRKNLLDLYQRYSTASCCKAFSYKPLIYEDTGLPNTSGYRASVRSRGCQTWRI